MLRSRLIVATAFAAALPAIAYAQTSKLKVISTDSLPIVYAYVSIQGGMGQITDENGEIALGAGKKQTLSARVQRIGYQPWFGKIDLPDTAVVVKVLLSRLAQSMSTVNVKGTAAIKSLQLTGFYDRWMMRQKGTLSAVFIGPEEIEFRHPDKISNMLSGLNGVSFRRSCEGEQVIFAGGGTCPMAILIDGVRQCPSMGCKTESNGLSGALSGTRGKAASTGGGRENCDSIALLDHVTAVLIDQVLDANDVSAIEVYTRGGNMPSSLSVSDQSCGAVAFWTGTRKP